MATIQYIKKRFSGESKAIVDHANVIIEEYAAQGYDLTLRQLYYQFVSRDLLANNDKSYKRLGNIISDARRAGLVDWDRIVDRTRFIRNPAQWDSPSSMVSACADQYDVDWWEMQLTRPEVWIEKDALVGVLETACEPWHCSYFSCRGYVSDSEIWSSAQRMSKNFRDNGQSTVVFHLGDHDPSGIDMSRDIEDRLRLFCDPEAVQDVAVKRIALTMVQVKEVDPPPNPAKITDARFISYQELYGDESWELDALDPTYIGNLIAKHMDTLIDVDEWMEAEKRRDGGRERLREIADSM